MDIIWISQIGLALLMLAMGYYLLKHYGLEFKTKTITYIALLMVVSILLGSFLKIELPLLGPNSFEIKFDTLPIFFIGMLFGPTWGFVSGFMIDMIQLILTPTPYPFLGFTLNLMLTGAIAGIMFHGQKKFKPSSYQWMTQLLVFSLLVVSLALVWFLPSFRINREQVVLSLTVKIGVSLALAIVSGLLMFMNLKIQKSEFSLKYMRLLIICEVLIQMLLTSLWLAILFKIPFVLSLAPRIIEGLFMVLALHIAGMALAKALFSKELMKETSDYDENTI